MVQEIVVSDGIAGVDTNARYKDLKAASVKGDFYLLQCVQHTQNKTAKNHRDKIQELIMSFFEQTADPIVNSIKKDLFEVADGKPIVGPEHHVIKDMMALPPPSANGVHPSSHARAHTQLP